MAKVERTKVVVDARDYNFDKRYEDEMKQFEDVNVVSIALILSEQKDGTIREEYLVFHEDVQEEDDSDVTLEEGDFVYWIDGNTSDKIYETVEKVTQDDGMHKCFMVGGGFLNAEEVILVAKKKDRKDI